MAGPQRIVPIRRNYNRWVANQTLEDFALRFTARSARRWSGARVSQTALGAIAFLALEAIGGTITLSYGFSNVLAATLVVGAVLFLTGLPISQAAARYGVDIDLLTRGAGFGYIGSTVTSLVYATFTFILFAIEASIMSAALSLCFGVPPWLGHILSALAVIPLVTFGISWISRFQIWTQPLWIILNILPLAFIAGRDWPSVHAWMSYQGLGGDRGLDLLGFGGAASVILALMPQIGEQVDVLRFFPAGDPKPRWSARLALIASGPGWIFLGIPKLLFGSLLAVVAMRHGIAPEHAGEPASMYLVAFGFVVPGALTVAWLTASFVVVSQLKINVMNAYAGSLAWSNFFSRLTHSHPGRVVWLFFNVAIALLLMELGVYAAIERVLSLFAIVAVAWLGAVAADLAINRPLGLAPSGIEFKRAYLYDINPVGTGAMALATVVAFSAAAGSFGATVAALAPFVALGTAVVTAPLIAWATGGRYYLARAPEPFGKVRRAIGCVVCEHAFEPEDTAACPAYGAPICSLCCSLDARCRDLCKPHGRVQAQLVSAARRLLPAIVYRRVSPRLFNYLGIHALITVVISLVLLLVHLEAASSVTDARVTIDRLLLIAFAILFIVAGVLSWFVVLAQESRRVAEEESDRQTALLQDEIDAHRRTDAALQKAKEAAEAANFAKSRYLVGLSHELRTPLNAVLGYAQLLERVPATSSARENGIRVIRRSAEHLSGLIDGLLDISRIEAGRLQIAHEGVRIADLLEQVVDMFRLQARGKGLAFEYQPSATLPPLVRTDGKRLRQILINLLSNAVKFTARGQVVLRVGYRNQVARLTVEDSGPGIPAANLQSIFEPFDRGPETSEAVPGLGLGLTIAKLLTQLMGGDLAVESEPGRGSRFHIKLMLAAAEAIENRALQVGPYRGAPQTAMVVDDDPDHQALMRELLEPIGFVVLAARDAPTCLSLVNDVRPDVFILDISLPGLSGWDLLRTLRGRGFEFTPAVIISANIGATPVEISDPDHRGPDALLPKPLDMARLLDVLGSLLGLQWSAPSTNAGAASSGASEPFSLPASERDALIALARIGHVKAIETRLDDIAAAQPSAVPALNELRRRLESFDLSGVIGQLEGAIDA